MALYGIANTQLTDTFNEWRVASNEIKAQAASISGNNTFIGDYNFFNNNTSFNRNVVVSGNTSVGVNLTVSGTTNLNGAVNLGDTTFDLTAAAGRLTVGTNLDVAGNTAVTGILNVTNSVQIGTHLNIDGPTSVGTNLAVTANTTSNKLFVGPKAQHWNTLTVTEGDHSHFETSNTATYSGVGIKNVNDSDTSSSDLMIYAAQGDDSGGYIELGINSSTYNDPSWGVTHKDDGYLLFDAIPGATGDGDLIIATGTNGTQNRIVLAAGGFVNSTPYDVTITPNTGMVINYPTTSTSPTTGALIVDGGVGIQGDLYVQGNFNLVGNVSIGGNGSIVTTSTLQVSNSLIYMAEGNISDAYDIGFLGAYNDGTYGHTGFVRDATDKVWKLFSDVNTEPANNTISFGSATYDAIKVGSVTSLGSVAVTNQLSSNTIGKTGGTQFVLPTSDGSSGQALVTNGSGTLSFGSAGVSTGKAIAMAMIFGG